MMSLCEQDPHPKVRWASIHAVGVYCYYQGPFFQNDCADKIVGVSLALMVDVSQRVRVRHAVGFCEPGGVDTVATRPDVLLTGGFVVVVLWWSQAHTASALINFADQISPDKLLPHVDSLLPPLFAMLQSGSKSEKENAITAVSSVADSATDQFERFFDSFMPILMWIVETQTDKELRVVRGKAMECLSIIGGCVPPERFKCVRRHRGHGDLADFYV